MTTRIVIEASDVASIPVTLVGKDYDIRPPKAAVMIRFAEAGSALDAKYSAAANTRSGRQATARQAEAARMLTDLVDGFIDQALEPAVAVELKARMADPADALDIMHVMALIKALTSEVTGNPTSSASD